MRIACLIGLAVAVLLFQRPDEDNIVSSGDPVPAPAPQPSPDDGGIQEPLRPLQLNAIASSDTVPMPPDAVDVPQKQVITEIRISDERVISEIDRLIDTAWKENQVEPASEADDHGWIRRTYLATTVRVMPLPR